MVKVKIIPLFVYTRNALDNILTAVPLTQMMYYVTLMDFVIPLKRF